MEMPKPTAQHAKLEALAGEWRGEETLHPSPWAPEKRTATGRFSNRIGLDGMFLINDYTEERDGEVVFRGHGVYGWDAARQRYTMFWFDSMGMSPRETLGTWEGNTLTFEAEDAQGKNRYVYEIVDGDRFRFSILASWGGGPWQPVLEGEYLRC